MELRPRRPGSCTPPPTVSGAPSATKSPSSLPSPAPSPLPSFTFAPSAAPTAEDGGGGGRWVVEVSRAWRGLAFGFRVAAVVGAVLLATTCCVACCGGRPRSGLRESDSGGGIEGGWHAVELGDRRGRARVHA